MTEEIPRPGWEPEEAKPQTGALKALAEEMATWVRDSLRLECSWSCGVFGGRGSGKTSLLLTLLEVLRKRAKDDPSGFKGPILPASDEEVSWGNKKAPLFAPSDIVDDDDLLFLLVDHLVTFYGGTRPDRKKVIQEIRNTAVQKLDFERRVEYEKEISASARELPQRLVELRVACAATTRKLQESFAKLCSDITDGNTRSLLLLVDDLDLKPHRSLELLDLLRLYLDRPGVMVVFAADRDTIIETLSWKLDKQGLKNRQLPALMLDKLIPYQWNIPVASPKDRLEYVWKTLGEVRQWWPEEAANILRRPPRASGQETKSPTEPAENLLHEIDLAGLEVYDLAHLWLAPLLPRTYRGLKAVHNRLLGLRAAYEGVSKAEAKALAFVDLLPFYEKIALSPKEIGLQRTIRAPFLSLLVAFDVRFSSANVHSASDPRSPELVQPLVDAALRLPESVANLMRTRAHEAHRAQNDTAPRQFTNSELHRHEYEEALQRLALAWSWWSSIITVDEIRFLAISLNADAKARGGMLWKGVCDEAQVSRWHLDLTEFCPRGGRANPEALQRAAEKALGMIQAAGIADYKGQVELLAKAQLSLLMWLGWNLRYLDRVAAFNDFAGRFARFDGPTERVRYLNRGTYEILKPGAPQLQAGGTPHEAIVLIDLLGKSNLDQLAAFVSKDGADQMPVRAEFGIRLLPPSQAGRMGPENLLPILDDIVELLGSLFHERGITLCHLGFLGPDVAAFFLGQQIHALGHIRLYEYYDDPPRYLPVFDIDQSTS